MTQIPEPCARGVAQAARDAAAQQPDSPATRRTRRLILAGTVLGSSLAFIDGSAVSLTLPIIQQRLGGDVASAQWIMNAYMLLLGALVLAGGAAADRYGRRRIFLVGVAIFTVASLACGLAPSLPFLIAARAVQGVGAALLTPASLALLGASFDAKSRGQAVGFWAGASGLMSAAGPVLGGWITDAVSWRAVFLINLPVAAVAVALVLLAGEESRGRRVGSVDWLGAAVVTASLALFTWALTGAPGRGFGDPTIAGALALGLVGLGVFLFVERRAESPMTPLELFRSSTFSGLNVYTLLLYGAFSGALFLLPFLLLRVHGYGPTMAGAALAPLSIGMAILSPVAGRIAGRIGARPMVTLGPLFVAGGLALMAWRADVADYWRGAFPGLVLLAVGLGVAVAPLTDAVLGAVDDEYEGAASGINNAVARIAGLLAVALVGFVMASSAAEAILAGYRSALWIAAGVCVAASVIAVLTVRAPKPDLPAGAAEPH